MHPPDLGRFDQPTWTSSPKWHARVGSAKFMLAHTCLHCQSLARCLLANTAPFATTLTYSSKLPLLILEMNAWLINPCRTLQAVAVSINIFI